jgi:large subunit ribosomal protein L30
MGQVVEHDSNPTILGMIKVKHLVSVEENNKYCYEFK